MNTEEKYYVNDYGVRISKCCASCCNKDYKNDGRICQFRRSKVDKSDWCDLWTLNPGFENAGKMQGGVKDIRYLNYMLNSYLDEQRKAEEAKSKGEIYTPYPASHFTDIWLETHDSIYTIQ